MPLVATVSGASAGRIEPGTTSDLLGGFEDWLPTILAAAQQPLPGELKTDVAADHPLVVARLETLTVREHELSGEFPLVGLDQPAGE